MRSKESLQYIKNHPACSIWNYVAINSSNKVDNSSVDHFKVIESSLDKLEKYELIEKNLGIDLDILIKALTEGICINFYGSPHHTKAKYLKLDLANDIIHWDCYDDHFPGAGITYYLYDYGITWALTEEELSWKKD